MWCPALVQSLIWNFGLIYRLDEQIDHIPVRTVTVENQSRTLENMKAQYIAVNGIRKVSCVVSDS